MCKFAEKQVSKPSESFRMQCYKIFAFCTFCKSLAGIKNAFGLFWADWWQNQGKHLVKLFRLNNCLSHELGTYMCLTLLKLPLKCTIIRFPSPALRGSQSNFTQVYLGVVHRMFKFLKKLPESRGTMVGRQDGSHRSMVKAGKVLLCLPKDYHKVHLSLFFPEPNQNGQFQG